MNPRPVHSGRRDELPRFCIDCRYPLRGLDDIGNCPECGRPYNLNNAYTYAWEEREPTSLPSLLWHLMGWMVLTGLLLLARWLIEHGSMLIILFPVLHFVGVLFALTSVKVHRLTDRVAPMMIVGSVIGGLPLAGIDSAPLAPVMGLVVGAFAGLALNMIQMAGWVD